MLSITRKAALAPRCLSRASSKTEKPSVPGIRNGSAKARPLTSGAKFFKFGLRSHTIASTSTPKRGYCIETQEKPKAQPKKKEEVAQTTIGNLDIRIGKILDIDNHPDADTLYVEKIDVGESEPRTIISGLAKYMSKDDLKLRRVLVVCNLPAKPLRGIPSNGMLLASANAEGGLALVEPPADAAVGEAITFAGVTADVVPNISGNKLSKILKNCHVAADGKAFWKDAQGNEVHWQTSAGACTSKLPNSNIS